MNQPQQPEEAVRSPIAPDRGRPGTTLKPMLRTAARNATGAFWRLSASDRGTPTNTATREQHRHRLNDNAHQSQTRRKTMHTTRRHAIAALVLGTLCATAHAAETPHAMTATEEAKWAQQMQARTMEIRATRKWAVRWGKTEATTAMNVIILDPPVPRTGDRSRVHVEWFSSWIDATGGSTTAVHTRRLVQDKWAVSVAGRLREKVWVLRRYLATGPGLGTQYEEQRKHARHLWLVTGQGQSANRRLAERARSRFVRKAYSNGLTDLTHEARVEATAERWKVPWKEWRNESAGTVGRITRFTDNRWKSIAERAMAVQPDVFAGIPDPIILINGKYLITQNTARNDEGKVKGPQRVLRIANGIIAELVHRTMAKVVREEDIVFRNQLEPREGQVVRLENPQDPDANMIDVEWLYTYVSEEGQVGERRWIENLLKPWHSSVYRGGVWDWTLKKTPAGRWTREESEWSEHHRVHQSLILAWDDEEHYERSHVHVALAGKLWEDPGAVRTDRTPRETW